MSKLVYVPNQKGFMESIGTSPAELTEMVAGVVLKMENYDEWGTFLCAEMDNVPDKLKAFALKYLIDNLTNHEVDPVKALLVKLLTSK